MLVELGECRRDCDCLERGTGEGEEGVGREPGAGAVGAPLMMKEARIWVDVAISGGVAWSGVGGAVLRITAVGVLGP